MRMMKMALIAVAALLLGSASALAITVQKKRDAPGEPTDLWTLVGDFCAIKDWHPGVADCQATKEDDVTYRTLTLKDGGKIKEKLIGKEETSYSYEIVESPLPVKNYKATLSVEEDEDTPERSEVHWDATFDAEGASDEDAKKKVGDIFEAGVKGIKQQAIAAHDAREAAAGGAPTKDADEDDDEDDR
jgi:Polyketide cyclase / dehydrase and lipid transport